MDQKCKGEILICAVGEKVRIELGTEDGVYIMTTGPATAEDLACELMDAAAQARQRRKDSAMSVYRGGGPDRAEPDRGEGKESGPAVAGGDTTPRRGQYERGSIIVGDTRPPRESGE